MASTTINNARSGERVSQPAATAAADDFQPATLTAATSIMEALEPAASTPTPAMGKKSL